MVSQGKRRLRKRSAANTNEPFRTTMKSGFFPLRSLSICAASSFTLSLILSSDMYRANFLSLTCTRLFMIGGHYDWSESKKIPWHFSGKRCAREFCFLRLYYSAVSSSTWLVSLRVLRRFTPTVIRYCPLYTRSLHPRLLPWPGIMLISRTR